MHVLFVQFELIESRKVNGLNSGILKNINIISTSIDSKKSLELLKSLNEDRTENLLFFSNRVSRIFKFSEFCPIIIHFVFNS